MKIIQLKPHKTDSLKRMHPWIFSGAIASLPKGLEEGDLVDVCVGSEFVARGYYEIGSIAVRVLTFDSNEVIDHTFWVNRLQQAYRLREAIGLISDDSTYRLIHGEGDYIPGLIIDIYGHTAVMQAHTVAMHRLREELSKALDQVYCHRLRTIYYKSETTLPFKSETDDRSGILHGESDGLTDVDCQENGIRFYPDLIKGQKTGFFIDQRDNRALLEQYSVGRRVLNMFCYTGGFSLYALRGGADRVVSVDSSAKAIDMLERNLALNFDADRLARHSSLSVDAFKYLSDMDAEQYDLIVLDPPAFAKHRGVLHNALQGYRRINAEALKKIASGGILFTFSCSQAVSPIQFRQAVFTASVIANRKVRVLHTLTQPADHPVSIYHPEGEYLKGLVLYVE